MKDLGEWADLAGDDFQNQFHQALRDATRMRGQVQAPTAALDFAWTDLGNAERLVARLGDHMAWNEQYGFLSYRDGAYDRDDGRRRYIEWANETKERIAEGRALIVEGERTGNALLVDHGEAIVGYFTGCQSKFRTEAAVEMTKALCHVPRDQFDTKIDLLVVANGTVNLSDGTLQPHSPSHPMTHRLKVAYDPAAECPLWEQCWVDWFPDHPEIRTFFQTYMGYAISGRVDLQTVLMSIGDGGTGKSTCFNVVHHICEPIAWATNWSTFDKKPSGSGTSDLAATAFARILLAAESDMGVRMSESILKRCSGGDAMTAAFKYCAEFVFWPRYKVFLVTNHFPQFNDPSDGLWRRLLTVMWQAKQTDHRDLTMEARLLKEGPGILRWLVDGARTFYSEGLTVPPVITEWTTQFRETSDPLADFIEGHLVVDPDAVTVGQQVFDRYRAWAQDQGIRHMRDRSLYAALTERLGVEKFRQKAGVQLQGVRLMTSADREGCRSVAGVAVSKTPYLDISSTVESFGKTATPAAPATSEQVRDTESGVAGVSQVSQDPLDLGDFGQ